MEVELKPGYLTTEFWVSLAATIIPIANQIFKLNLDINELTQGIMLIAPAIFYVLSRTLVKGKVAGMVTEIESTRSLSTSVGTGSGEKITKVRI
jgi:hypothetical protein